MIYLDNSATTRTLDAAADAARKYMSISFFNPSSAYAPAVESEKAVESARARLARVIGAQADEIIYTSGGTESNNAAVSGTLKAMRGTGRLIVGATEHPSVYEVIKAYAALGYDVVEAPVDAVGAVDIEALASLVTQETMLVSVMQVNNEVGAVNDAASIYKTVKNRAPDAIVHMDGVQGFLKVPFDAGNTDLYTVSGHKFHAPKGVGALYVKNGVRFAGGQAGGGQENNRRSGTTNTPGIMGMDAAIADYTEHLEEYRRRMYACKLRLAKNLLSIRDTVINGPAPQDGAPHILNVSFFGVRGEVLLHALEAKEIYVSTGSACSAHKKGKNRILTAMGVAGARQEGAIRFSLCPFNTEAEMDAAAMAIVEQVTFLRRYKRR
jgi:cysteine desulfurase